VRSGNTREDTLRQLRGKCSLQLSVSPTGREGGGGGPSFTCVAGPDGVDGGGGGGGGGATGATCSLLSQPVASLSPERHRIRLTQVNTVSTRTLANQIEKLNSRRTSPPPLPTDEERDAAKKMRVEEVLLTFPTKDQLIEEYVRLMHSVEATHVLLSAKGLFIVTFYSKCSRALTFENLCQRSEGCGEGETCGISSGEWALMDVAQRLKVVAVCVFLHLVVRASLCASTTQSAVVHVSTLLRPCVCLCVFMCVCVCARVSERARARESEISPWTRALPLTLGCR